MNREELRRIAEAATYNGGDHGELAEATLALLDRLDRAERVTPPDGWFPFGSHAPYPWIDRIEFSEEKDEAGMPLWERPVAPNVIERPDFVMPDPDAPTDDEREALIKKAAKAIFLSAEGYVALGSDECERYARAALPIFEEEPKPAECYPRTTEWGGYYDSGREALIKKALAAVMRDPEVPTGVRPHLLGGDVLVIRERTDAEPIIRAAFAVFEEAHAGRNVSNGGETDISPGQMSASDDERGEPTEAQVSDALNAFYGESRAVHMWDRREDMRAALRAAEAARSGRES